MITINNDNKKKLPTRTLKIGSKCYRVNYDGKSNKYLSIDMC